MSHLSFYRNQIKLEMLTISHYFSFRNTHNFHWSSLSSNNCQSNLRFHSFQRFSAEKSQTNKVKTHTVFLYRFPCLLQKPISTLYEHIILISIFNNCRVLVGSLPDRHLLPDLRGGVHQLAGEDDPHCESELSLFLLNSMIYSLYSIAFSVLREIVRSRN